jgi:dienelactone hydrolase
MLGSAIAVAISDIPFDGPCATTQVGMIDGEFIINPNGAQNAVSDLKLTVASTSEKVIMIEAGANEIPEDKMIEAIYLAHSVNQEIIAFINKIVAECGKPKHEYTSCAVPEELFAAIKEIVPPAEMEEAVFTDEKQVREENMRVITDRLEAAFAENEEWMAVLGDAIYQYEKKTVRKMILKDHKRPDGRAITQIRPLAAEVDIIPRVHGSAMFTRGQTQICNVCTLAPLSDAQRAIRTLRSLGYEKVGICGFSAGGHLTCTSATLYDFEAYKKEDEIDAFSARPDAFIPCYPVVTFQDEFTHMGSRKNLLSSEWESKELVELFSNEKNIKTDTPPAFIWHTATDEAVPVKNSLELARALSENGVHFELHIFPVGNHGLGLAYGHEDIRVWSDCACTFLKKLGF